MNADDLKDSNVERWTSSAAVPDMLRVVRAIRFELIARGFPGGRDLDSAGTLIERELTRRRAIHSEDCSPPAG